MNKIKRIPAFLLAGTAIILEIIRILLYLVTTRVFFEIFFVASICLSVAVIYIFFVIFDKKKHPDILRKTGHHLYEKGINGQVYMFCMTLAMVLCTTADYIIKKVDFIVGLALFLTAHILIIIAFCNIIHTSPKLLLEALIKRKGIIPSTIILVLIIPVYIFGIYDPNNFITLIALPYMIIIYLMTVATFIAFTYKSRPPAFRIMPVVGSVLFIISDVILAIDRFSTKIPHATFYIVFTYLTALILLQGAILFLEENRTDKKELINH